MIEIHLDGKPVTKLQAARAVSEVDGRLVHIGEPDENNEIIRGRVVIYPRHHARGELQPARVSWLAFGAVTAEDARDFLRIVALGAEIAELAEMLAAEQEADKPKPVVWQCTYCWTEYEAMPSEQPPACPECGPLHGPGARDAQPRVKPEPEAAHPFDAGEGNRELSGPGRELLRAAIAEQDAADAAAEATWLPLADGACGDGIDENGEGIACGVTAGHLRRHERESRPGLGAGIAHWPNLADPETGTGPQPAREQDGT